VTQFEFHDPEVLAVVRDVVVLLGDEDQAPVVSELCRIADDLSRRPAGFIASVLQCLARDAIASFEEVARARFGPNATSEQLRAAVLAYYDAQIKLAREERA
jgi:hypothetical protein